ncbi:RNA polymerase sigma factor [Mucilaginibacter myungsuensis]|uniref:Sigma-70 family RNA polymerase sigma factor n=1 Tax=Mucilaginibacter myungsuensis TaxID=649104 RepID=A0A929L0C3_9SPHI|nr:sigma-70 family RNA polymerase sigma factor [Mucilaginibacter myungsuensis]MBE9663263.1 sigma-70 family RNA polymerase sigma factor [Mucilaginibacter myungsuensis]MDN3598897.1 sigma-70 family RNA polymerase sigma factor [Mucilaginibacter myungsuensis]
MAAHTLSAYQRQQVFTDLYLSAFPSVARYVSRRGGSFDEAKDVFQDAMLVWYEKAVAGQIPQNDKAYLMGIAKHLWVKRYEVNKRYIPLDDAGNSADIFDLTEKHPVTNRIMHYLQSTGQKCMDLLKSFYYDKLPMKDIAENFGFSGERSATVQKFKCLEKVREAVKCKGLIYEDFVE